uniref:Uncharacterized protein n=1 Tax=viral metagenome TaxID=1070528 RepID=A0A6C0KTC1_9ZZZZ
MSVKKILENIAKINPKQNLQYFSIEEPSPLLYNKEYKELADRFDDDFLSQIDLKKVANFLSDYNEYVFFKLGYQIVIYNMPHVSKLKYEDNEDVITSEHIFDTIKEIDDSVKIVAHSPPDIYLVVCDQDKRVAELLNGKLVGTNILCVKRLEETAQKFQVLDYKVNEEEDICTTALVVAFFISMASLFALQYLFS